jgi:glutamyl/glutaminyl-tRNA synthetase
VTDGLVDGWNDPRMPTIEGMRRRGFSPAGIRLFAQRIGVSKGENIIDMSVLEGAVREMLENESPRVMAVLDPIKVTSPTSMPPSPPAAARLSIRITRNSASAKCRSPVKSGSNVTTLPKCRRPSGSA